jgi:hypothetical protein
MIERAHVDFYGTVLKPDPSRTVIRPFEPGYPHGFDHGRSRTEETVELIVALDEEELSRQLKGVTASLDENHRDVDATLLRRFGEMAGHISSAATLSPAQQRLVGAYFTQEYAYEAAALFNPSAVRQPDQTRLEDGSIRFVLALRGVGEGHVSSVTFRTGVWTPGGALTIDDPGATSVPPIIVPRCGSKGTVELDCSGSRSISETVLFPVLPSQRQGIEDMRLVRFTDDDASVTVTLDTTDMDG